MFQLKNYLLIMDIVEIFAHKDMHRCSTVISNKSKFIQIIFAVARSQLQLKALSPYE